jgi:hypothetical protein
MATATFTTCAAQLPTLADLEHIERVMRRFQPIESAASWRAVAEWMADKGYDPQHGCVLVLPPAMATHFPPDAPGWVRINGKACAVLMANPRALGLQL